MSTTDEAGLPDGETFSNLTRNMLPQDVALLDAYIDAQLRQVGGRWAQRYRQAWIAEALHVYRYIRREHLMRKFGISVPQASLDLQTFLREHPGAMVYNSVKKRYEAAR